MLESALDSVDSALASDTTADFATSIRTLADIAVMRPDIWELAERDARHLADTDRARVLERIRSIGRWLRSRIEVARPDLTADDTTLLARAVLALLTMPSAYAPRMAPTELVALLAAASSRAIEIPASRLHPGTLLEAPDLTTTRPTSRREHMLREAGRLFSERGYENVTMSDIGDAVGMAGPSLYYYVEGKAELLANILRRGLELLAIDRARHDQHDVADALRVLLESYARLALSWREIFRLFVHEQIVLQHIDQGAVVRAYRDVVQGGVVLLRELRPAASEAQARALLGCAMSVINDLAITGPGDDRRPTATALVAVAMRMIEPVSDQIVLSPHDVLQDLA